MSTITIQKDLAIEFYEIPTYVVNFFSAQILDPLDRIIMEKRFFTRRFENDLLVCGAVLPLGVTRAIGCGQQF